MINVDDVVQESIYTGEDIDIGIYDALKTIDSSHSEFSNRQILIKDSYLSGNHANMVTLLAAGNSGIARNSNLFMASNLDINDYIDDMKWFVSDENDVHIINATIGGYNEATNGTYHPSSKGIDNYIKNYFVTFVSSAGNNDVSPANRISPMSTGYNMISVGNSGATSDVRHNTSCYVEQNVYLGSKPNIMAPGSVTTIFNDDIGTSYSAPLVTGCIALLMEEFPYLIGYPELITSIVTSSASPMSSTYNVSSGDNHYDASGLHNEIGSGLLNYEKMREAAETCLDIFVPSNSSPEEVVDYIEFDANANHRIRASLSWLANGTDTNNFTNYDLYLHKKNGSTYKLMKYIDGTTNNVEFLDFDVQLSGTYRLSVKQNETNVTGDYLGLSYVLIDDSIGGSTSGGKYGHEVYNYISISNTKHRGTCLCGCGGIIEESHVFRITGVGTPSKCIYCGKTSGGIPGIFPLNNNKEYVTENGSFKLFNGVTYLVEKDIEAYLNGSLVFMSFNSSKV